MKIYEFSWIRSLSTSVWYHGDYFLFEDLRLAPRELWLQKKLSNIKFIELDDETFIINKF